MAFLRSLYQSCVKYAWKFSQRWHLSVCGILGRTIFVCRYVKHATEDVFVNSQAINDGKYKF